MTYPLASITYPSTVSRDYGIIEFVTADLNGWNILAADIGNSYFNAPFHIKVYFTAGADFGHNKYSNVIVFHALYVLKSSRASWISQCVETMRDMDFVPSEANPNLCMKNSIE